MKKYFLLLCFFLLIGMLYCQTKKIEIMFTLNDSTVDLKSDFDIYLVVLDSTSKIILKPCIKNNSFYWNNELNDFYGYKYIVFGYKDKYYAVSESRLLKDQDMKIEFKYSENFDKSCATIAIIFYPLEIGDGAMRITEIPQIDEYFEISKLIIDINHYPKQSISKN
jgi:hypothetical protein